MVNDSEILKDTVFSPPDEKGRVQLRYTTPSGRLIESTDWLVPEEIKGKVLIAWAQAIRDSVEQELAQVNAEAEARVKAAQQAQKSPSPAHWGESAPAANATLQSSSNAPSNGFPAPAGTYRDSSTRSSDTLPDDPRSLVDSKIATLTLTRATLEDQLVAITKALSETQDNIERWTSVRDKLDMLEHGGHDLSSTERGRIARKRRAKKKGAEVSES